MKTFEFRNNVFKSREGVVESFTVEVVAHTEQEARTRLDAALYNKYDRHEVRYERKSKRLPIDFIAERLAVERYDFDNFKPMRFGVKEKGYFDKIGAI